MQHTARQSVFKACALGTIALLAESAYAIDGGRFADPFDLESQFAVRIFQAPDNESVNCTGSLISENLVLTAAHCLLTARPNTFATLAVARTLAVDIPAKSHFKGCRFIARIEDFRVRTDFTQEKLGLNNDIALLKVKSEDERCPTRPIALVTASRLVQRGDQVRVSGYGPSNTHDYPTPRLRISTGIVRQAVRESQEIRVSWDEGVNLNYGDSGGPALVGYAGRLCLIGVNTTGTAYTAVTSHLEWIVSQAKELGAVPPRVDDASCAG